MMKIICWLFLLINKSQLHVHCLQDISLTHWNWSQTLFSNHPKQWVSYVHISLDVTCHLQKCGTNKAKIFRNCADVLKHINYKIWKFLKKYKHNPVESVHEISSKSVKKLEENAMFASFQSNFSLTFPMAMIVYDFPMYRDNAFYENRKGPTIFNYPKSLYCSQTRCSWKEEGLGEGRWRRAGSSMTTDWTQVWNTSTSLRATRYIFLFWNYNRMT